MKLCIIIGGSRGLGKAIAEIARRDQWHTVACSRTGDILCDLASVPHGIEPARQKIIEMATQQWEEIRVVLNAGAIEPIGFLKTLSDDEISEGITTNITGTIAVLSTVLSAFETHSCRKMILFVSSGAALYGRAGWSIYNCAKAGMENLICAVAEEQKCEPLPFETVRFDPGVMDTAMQKRIRNSSADSFPSVDRFAELHRTGQLRSPDLVAAKIWARMNRPFQSAERVAITDLL